MTNAIIYFTDGSCLLVVLFFQVYRILWYGEYLSMSTHITPFSIKCKVGNLDAYEAVRLLRRIVNIQVALNPFISHFYTNSDNRGEKPNNYVT